MTKLSPAAHAVWNAFLDRYEWNATTEELFAIATALRAAALYCKRDKLILLSLATELEAQ